MDAGPLVGLGVADVAQGTKSSDRVKSTSSDLAPNWVTFCNSPNRFRDQMRLPAIADDPDVVPWVYDRP